MLLKSMQTFVSNKWTIEVIRNKIYLVKDDCQNVCRKINIDWNTCFFPPFIYSNILYVSIFLVYVCVLVLLPHRLGAFIVALLYYNCDWLLLLLLLMLHRYFCAHAQLNKPKEIYAFCNVFAHHCYYDCCCCCSNTESKLIKKNVNPCESLAFNHPHSSFRKTATRTTTTITDKWYHHRVLHSRFPFRKKGNHFTYQIGKRLRICR